MKPQNGLLGTIPAQMMFIACLGGFWSWQHWVSEPQWAGAIAVMVVLWAMLAIIVGYWIGTEMEE